MSAVRGRGISLSWSCKTRARLFGCRIWSSISFSSSSLVPRAGRSSMQLPSAAFSPLPQHRPPPQRHHHHHHQRASTPICPRVLGCGGSRGSACEASKQRASEVSRAALPQQRLQQHQLQEEEEQQQQQQQQQPPRWPALLLAAALSATTLLGSGIGGPPAAALAKQNKLAPDELVGLGQGGMCAGAAAWGTRVRPRPHDDQGCPPATHTTH